MPYQVHITTPTKELAQELAKGLVSAQLAACVQVLGPIKSHYEWKGKVEQAEEWLCLIKCTRENYSQLEQKICEMHPYEVPEIIATPIENGLKSYLKWIEE